MIDNTTNNTYLKYDEFKVEHFDHPQKYPCNPPPFHPCPLATIDTTDFTISRNLCKWNHSIIVLFCLAAFAQHPDSEARVICAPCVSSLLSSIAEQCPTAWVSHPSPCGGNLGVFQLYSETAVSVNIQVFLGTSFLLSEYLGMERLGGRVGNV